MLYQSESAKLKPFDIACWHLQGGLYVMIWTIVKKELSSNLISFRFILVFLLCCTLILVSAFTMRDKYEQRIKEYDAARAIHRKELEEKDLQSALNQIVLSGYKVDKPPAPLSVIVEGMEGAAGKYAPVNVLSTPRLEGGSGSDPVFAYFGTLDIMYIVRVVLSLVAILLTYDAISGEREQGTLKLSLSNSVPRHAVLLAKCVGGYITLLLPFLVPMLIGLLILTTSGSINFSGEAWARLGLISLASLLYVGVFLMLGLLVSSRTNRSTTSLMMLLFIWVVVVLALPKVSMITASKLRPVPSAQEVQAEKDARSSEVLKEGQEKIYKYIGELREAGGTPDENVIRAEIARLQEEITTDMTEESERIQVEYDKKMRGQFRLASNISRISPASVYTYAAIGLAHTGFDRQERFVDAARGYQPGLIQYQKKMMPKVMEQQRQQMMGQAVEDVKVNLDDLPALDFREATLADSWNSIWADFLILFLLLACFFMISYVGFVRSDVR
jgi:ABC-type transport system involved in multi-copper enzyme maturation permease subunit